MCKYFPVNQTVSPFQSKRLHMRLSRSNSMHDDASSFMLVQCKIKLGVASAGLPKALSFACYLHRWWRCSSTASVLTWSAGHLSVPQATKAWQYQWNNSGMKLGCALCGGIWICFTNAKSKTSAWTDPYPSGAWYSRNAVGLTCHQVVCPISFDRRRTETQHSGKRIWFS